MKTVVVTGSTRGIGRGLAREFLARGCKVVVSGRSEEVVTAVVAELDQPERVTGKACDITDINQLWALWDHACQAFGEVDVWINNAGMDIPRKPVWEASVEDLRAIVETNLTAVLLANKVAITGMKAQGYGQIWNMEGFGSNGMVQAGMAPYGATKRAVNYLNKALRKDVEDSGIQICTLSPGIVLTDLLLQEYDKSSAEWERAKRIFNIMADTVGTVTPWLADGVLKADRDGAKVEWLTGPKIGWRFLRSTFIKRDLFSNMEL
jgi:NAD(P)-dependent dehydrogenase (short-subunit alcohol dehydrogenase family)